MMKAPNYIRFLLNRKIPTSGPSPNTTTKTSSIYSKTHIPEPYIKVVFLTGDLKPIAQNNIYVHFSS